MKQKLTELRETDKSIIIVEDYTSLSQVGRTSIQK